MNKIVTYLISFFCCLFITQEICFGWVRLSKLRNTGSGIMAKGSDKPGYFAISASDKKFVWAIAEIKHNKIIVWSDEVLKPLAVRYAWADDPEGANLYNKEGLSASPFRTDNF